MASTHLLCTGKIEQGGEVDWRIAPLPVEDGEMQRMIDEAADTEAYEDDMEDRAFWASGAW